MKSKFNYDKSVYEINTVLGTEIIVPQKFCSKCEQWKHVDDFYYLSSTRLAEMAQTNSNLRFDPAARRPFCKPCYAVYNREHS